MAPGDYLKKPYTRQVTPEEDGSFRAEIAEFPGCIALGDTDVEALAALSEVAISWIEARLRQNQPIPDPVEANAYSGKLVLRLPCNLHRKAAKVAAHDRVSLNSFIVAALAEAVGAQTAHSSSAYVPTYMITEIAGATTMGSAGGGSYAAPMAMLISAIQRGAASNTRGGRG